MSAAVNSERGTSGSVMFREIFRFELLYQTRQPVFWISSFFFFLLTFLAITTDAVVLGGSIGSVNRNAPFVIMQMLLIMSLLGVFVTTAFVAGTVSRDFEAGTQEIFFSTRMRKRDYLLGRFLGALVTAVGISIPVMLGIFLGSLMPWLESERIGPFDWKPYALSLLLLFIPNTILTGSVFFSLATKTRSIMLTYAGVVGMFVAYAIAGNLLSDMENESLAALLDPFGIAAFGITTKYWTVVERNSLVLMPEGALLLNRLAWLGAGLTVLAWTCYRFSFTVRSRKPRKGEEPADSAVQVHHRALHFTATSGRFSRGVRLEQYLRQTGMEIRGVVRSVAFPIILSFGILNMIGNSTVIDQLFGTPVYPVTHLMISILQGAFLFVFIIVTFYSGEIVWHERSIRMNELYDALPVPSWTIWGSKLTALAFVVLSLLVSAILTAIGIQAYRDYFHFEVLLYLKGFLLVIGIPFLLASVLAFSLQVLTNNKYLGFLLMILYFISGPALSALDFDHNLYNYGGAPNAPYSDMNGYGHFIQPLFWFYLYWSFFAVLLTVLVHLFWIRGNEEGLRSRIRQAGRRLSRPALLWATAAALAFLATGAWIFYNTNILNEYIPGDLEKDRLARYEKTYKKYEGLAQPRITQVYADVDIFPERRAVEIRGRYRLRNKTGETIDSLHFLLNRLVSVRRLSIPGAQLENEDKELRYSIYRLSNPLDPGEEMEMSFDLAVENRGFVNHDSNVQLVRNGTFFNNFQYFPHIGYTRRLELEDPNDRRKLGLPPVQRMAPIDDQPARQANYLTSESDWIEFETVVSTSPEQIAIAPGYLQREWRENGRRYFHYKMDAPILGFFSYLSADWEVARDRWNEVPIEIYHHRTHAYNVPRMIDAVKKSLDYFTSSFSPYQHRQVRIVEFPRYARFAQSFPNTIPFSESIGFIARLDEKDPEAIDYVFYVTAHEVAHQWWAHQVIGGNVQGATVLSETLSQYSALMVMEREYGREMMRRFLKYELDGYLRSRGGELIEELPLALVENQPYIHYRKGSVNMYALRDYIGEEVLNSALARYVRKVAFQQPPYTISREMLAEVRESMPLDQRRLLADLFETITLYENRATAATYQKQPDGTYRVHLSVESAKFLADGQGKETQVAVDDWIDVAVFGDKGENTPPEGKVLALEKRRLTGGSAVIEVVVSEEPRKAGIDPFNKLIDRNPENNITAATSRK